MIHDREKLLMEAEKEKMRANLLRAVSHDLRTPLTSIIGASATYLENSHVLSSKKKKQLVENISEDANWLLHMVENLLSVTRIRSENTSVTKSLESVEEVVSEAVHRFKKRMPGSSIVVSVPDELLFVAMDATLIEQVIINLFENAAIHSHSLEPTKCLVDVDETNVYFHIIDYGIGIREDRLASIFDGVSYNQNSNGDSSKGMGIGLSICKTIITAHGGQITATNHLTGVEFTFSLPLEEEKE